MKFKIKQMKIDIKERQLCEEIPIMSSLKLKTNSTIVHNNMIDKIIMKKGNRKKKTKQFIYTVDTFKEQYV